MKKLNRLKFKLVKFFVLTFGNVQFLGWAPFWCLFWGSTHYKVKGSEARSILNGVRKGDILLCTFDRYVSSWVIPGRWKHAAIYVGGNEVVQATLHGVVKDDILTFLRTDHVVVLRPPVEEKMRDNAAEEAKTFVGRQYDFLFDSVDDHRLFCSELVKRAYMGALGDLGDDALPPDRFFDIDGIKVVHSSKEWRKE
jgi:hypothetical protein